MCLSFKILDLCGLSSPWGSSNYRPSAPFLYEVASHVKNCHFSDYYSAIIMVNECGGKDFHVGGIRELGRCIRLRLHRCFYFQVNNAGILELGTIENTTLEQYDRVMNANVRCDPSSKLQKYHRAALIFIIII